MKIYLLVATAALAVVLSGCAKIIESSTQGVSANTTRDPGHIVAVSHIGATTLGNVIAGGAVGIAVDAASVANFHYDSPIAVPLGSPASAQSASASPAPSAVPPPANSPPRVDMTQPRPQDYPDSAQLNGEEGTVVVDIYVRQNGRPTRVRIERSSGFRDLDDAAVESVLNWRFIPATSNGDLVSDWTTVRVVYQLPRLPAQAPQSPR